MDTTASPVDCRFRSDQLDLLAAYANPEYGSMAPSMLVEGPSSSGKTYTLRKYFGHLQRNRQILFSEIQCEYCLTRKTILHTILRNLINLLDINVQQSAEMISKCDGLGTFVEVLKQIEHIYTTMSDGTRHPPVVFVLDRVERLLPNENSSELCIALSKAHEQSPALDLFTFVYVVNRSDSLNLQTLALPTIAFTCYSIDQIKDILLDWITDSDSPFLPPHQFRSFARQFLDIILDTYTSYFGSDIGLMVPVLAKLWPVFINPVNELGRIQNGTNDVLTTFQRNKSLLQSEQGLLDDLASADIPSSDLPKKTKYILIASYLASYDDPKYDLILFSKQREARSNRKVRHSKKKSTKPSDQLSSRMLSPQAFTLERLLAILHAIYDENCDEPLLNDVELLSELATLSTLKSVMKLKLGDTIGGGTKWKCNVNWSVIKKFSDDVGFEIENFLID
ncbi:hypothetical protein KL933_000592 [Ogataea haglerorum]|uniref:Orc1-like AAA ATPase domain-containing protein n=1 Tax=Ogataea haglerorum TaxID=1937702 RepID=A0AAN6D9V1_9ASCO|nr:uncharacterized protein KL911_003429 [Ogataea haglerorum]KAG7701717.1 hypothetical protein KL951_000173 [Ogataea haglerorum]KAG7711530.1 hypothetical protein KL914_000172 [Ogataea haglerorum]KAG7712301.1 hypothetical protein KL950_000172 [Ogataea haglerorum]KAG7722354.1 hypothetical protein KL913_000174 [Ogataea haglerorum]KAG7723542.1 hypothetical protein KL949_000592 [Ogataea haglerorum]